jgi:hypothetical protein
VFDEWVRACPLERRSGIAPGKRDVPGSLLPAILAAHRRYEHVTWLVAGGCAETVWPRFRTACLTVAESRRHHSRAASKASASAPSKLRETTSQTRQEPMSMACQVSA